jgi:hypothetical protein
VWHGVWHGAWLGRDEDLREVLRLPRVSDVEDALRLLHSE